MKATEFCYWLQGLFEIHNPSELNEKQTQLIVKHLQMVFVHEKENSKYLDFCKHLYGYLSFSETHTINPEVTNKIKLQLNTLFIHEVKQQFEDITFPKKGMQLHSNEVSELIRC